MEKVIVVLRRTDPNDEWCARLRGPVADDLLGLGIAGLSVSARDGRGREPLRTLTRRHPPVAALVNVWTQQCYGPQVVAALRQLATQCEQLAAYLVTESVPMA